MSHQIIMTNPYFFYELLRNWIFSISFWEMGRTIGIRYWVTLEDILQHITSRKMQILTCKLDLSEVLPYGFYENHSYCHILASILWTVIGTPIRTRKGCPHAHKEKRSNSDINTQDSIK